MRDFFRAWKRNAGVVTLVIACLFACAWVRSHPVASVICWQKDLRCVALLSHDGSVSYWNGELILCPSADGIQSGSADWKSVRDKLEVKIDRWLTIRYWPIIIPLALLSGYLLFSRPRSQPKQQVPHA